MKEVVYNYRRYCNNKIGHALLYYKTEQFVYENIFFNSNKSSRKYTSTWEEVEIARILNRLGYWVDIVDRSVSSDFIPEDKYDIYIGNGAGDSGKYYSKFAKQLTKAVRIFYANGPEPNYSNQLMKLRYELFNKRNPNANVNQKLRIISYTDISEKMRYTDAIFYFGNEFCESTYKKFNKSMYRVIPSSSSQIHCDVLSLRSKSKSKFLYFGGHGNIVKGLDYLIEVFDQKPELELYICAPNEADFMEFYQDKMIKENIHYEGFISVTSNIFKELTNKCGYIIFPSSSEGTATSVVTCMRKGLIPVVTRETGIDIENFGYLINDISVRGISKLVTKLSNISDQEFQIRTIKAYQYSQNFTEHSFSSNYENIILSALSAKI